MKKSDRVHMLRPGRTNVTAVVLAATVALGSCAGFDQAMSAMTGDFGMQAYTAEMQMRMVFPIVFYGYGGDPRHGYEPSVGTVWEQTDIESGEVYRYERALLQRNPDGTEWWYASTSAAGDISEFEVLVNERLEAIEMVWPDPETGEIRRHRLDEPVRADEEAEESEVETAPVRPEEVEDEELEGYEVDRERVNVTVGAGTFTAVHSRVEDEQNPENVYEVWTSDDVPGRLIKQRITDEHGEWSGELVEVTSGYTTRFGSY